MMQELPLERAFMLIEPGPVVLVTTRNGRKNNIMTISWHMVMDFGSSPRFALLTGEWNYSCEALLKNRECVLAIPGADLVRQTVEIGACSGRDTDKFRKFGLTPLKGSQVKAPLIAECLGNIECRVVDHIVRHNIFVLDGVAAWIDPEHREQRTFHAVGDGRFVVDGDTLNYRSLMAEKLPPGV